MRAMTSRTSKGLRVGGDDAVELLGVVGGGSRGALAQDRSGLRRFRLATARRASASAWVSSSAK
jgi:hypothetical protein